MSTEKEKSNKDFRERLKLVIGKNKAKFARLVGCTGPAVDTWLNGAWVRADILMSICEKTSTSANWLLLGVGPRELSPATPAIDDASRQEIERLKNELLQTQKELIEALRKNPSGQEHPLMIETRNEINKAIQARAQELAQASKKIA